MANILKRYLKGDYVVWTVYFALCVVSIVEMFSASSQMVSRTGSISQPITSHVTFLIIGGIMIFVLQAIHYRYIRMLSYVGLVASIVLLIYTSLKGVMANDAARWLSIGGFQFQPSELAKLCLIIVTADFVDRAQNPDVQKKFFPYFCLIICAVCGLILTENFSTAALLFGVVFLMMVIGGISWKRLGIFAGIIAVFIAIIFGITLLIPKEKYKDNSNAFYKVFGRAYVWVARFENFADSDKEAAKFVINDRNQQVVHAQIAVARGGTIGVGPGNSVQRNRLPEAFSDFVYAIIVEELGTVGGITVMLLYLMLLFRAGMIAYRCKTIYPAILVIGMILIIVVQAFVHIAVNVQLIPVTGQPLPLLSRGGTSIVITSIYFGIVLSISRYISDTAVSPQTEIALEADSAPMELAVVDAPQEKKADEE